jgi:hypothetical protein
MWMTWSSLEAARKVITGSSKKEIMKFKSEMMMFKMSDLELLHYYLRILK